MKNKLLSIEIFLVLILIFLFILGSFYLVAYVHMVAPPN